MPSILPLARTLAIFSLALSSLAAIAAEPITGTVTNGTTHKVSAGDQVTLIQLQQGMQESTHATTDARGHFSLPVPDEGIHLVRVTHQKANYFQPVQPDQHNIAVTVYDAAEKIEGVHTNVEELHVEATPTELHVVEVLQVLNESSPERTQFGPKGYDFFLPQGAQVGRAGAITQGGMPVQTPAVPLGDPGHYSFLFPIRPGETQFGIAYTLPYTGSFTFTPKLTTAVKTFAVLLPTTMKLKPGPGSPLSAQPGKPGTQSYLAQDIQPGQAPGFTVSGTGALPDQAGGGGGGPGAGPGAGVSDAAAPPVSNSDLAGGRGLNNPLDQSGDRDPWAKYKWWILSGLALLLAVAAGVMLRKPAGVAAVNASPLPPSPAWPPPAASADPQAATLAATLAALKEELFALETERLQRRITEPEYNAAKSALELILRRVLDRSDGARERLMPSAAESIAPQPEEPALTGRHDA